MANAVKLKELLTNINGRFDSIEFDSRAGRILIEQEQNKDMKSIAEIDSITRWIEHNSVDGLIDSMPLVDQINAIYEKQLDKAERMGRLYDTAIRQLKALQAQVDELNDKLRYTEVESSLNWQNRERDRDAIAKWKEARSEVKEAKEL